MIQQISRVIKIHTACSRCYGTGADQLASALKKLSTGSRKGKNKWYTNASERPVLLPASKLTETKGLGKQGLRRISVLNKLFMRNITDLMASGSMSEELLGHGIQVSKVQITPDFNMVNVYWVASGLQSDKDVEKLLKRAAGYVKHELSQLRVMGLVPHITFVKDSKLGKVVEVEELLKNIDFGEDYVPTDKATRLKTDLELKMQLPQDLVKKIQDMEQAEEDEEETLPEMKHNVFGLDQAGILVKISRDVKKVQTAWEMYENKRETSSTSLPMIEIEKNDEIQERFQKYLSSREFNLRPRRRSRRRDDYEVEEEVDDTEYFRDDDFIIEEDEIVTEK